MAEERKGLLERLKTRKTIILREPLLARLERKRRGSLVETEGWLVKPEWMSQEEWLKMTPCAVCGRRGWDEWAVSDEEWKRYVPLEYQDKEVCRVCYERFKRIREAKDNLQIGLHGKTEEKEKSTYQLFVEKASRELAEAKEHLRRYAETTECGWCKAKAEGLAKMTEQLEALTPLAQEFSEKVGALEAEELQKLSEEITQIREWLEKAGGNPAKKFHVRYIDQTTGKTVEKTIPDIEQYDLYRLQREGKISIIEIHTVK